MFVIGIVNAINISRSTIRKFVHFWCIFGVEAPEGSKVGHRTEYGDDPISVQARDSVEAALQYEMGRGFVTGSKLFFRSRRSPWAGFECCARWKKKQDGQKIAWHHSFQHDPRTIESQSEHSLLAVREQE